MFRTYLSIFLTVSLKFEQKLLAPAVGGCAVVAQAQDDGAGARRRAAERGEANGSSRGGCAVVAQAQDDREVVVWLWRRRKTIMMTRRRR